jgi:hypothetical protein
MRKVIAVLGLALALTGCSTAGVFSAVTSAVSPNKPEITAQVGAENVKQGLGVNSKVETTSKTEVGDVSGSAQVRQSQTKKSTQVQTGAVTATNMKVVSSDPYPMLIAFGIGMASVLGLVFWFVPTPRQLFAKKEV